MNNGPSSRFNRNINQLCIGYSNKRRIYLKSINLLKYEFLMGFFLFVPSRLSRRIKHKITISPIHKQFVEIFCGLLDSYISQKNKGVCVCRKFGKPISNVSRARGQTYQLFVVEEKNRLFSYPIDGR